MPRLPGTFFDPPAADTAKPIQTLGESWGRVARGLARVRLEYVFLVVALVWGLLQVFLVPPLQVPDEGDHWFRAWALTDGQLTPDAQGKLTVPASFGPLADLYFGLLGGVEGMNPLPVTLAGQPGFPGYENLFDRPGPAGTIEVGSRVARYGPTGYLPPAAGVALGRALGAAPLASFYLARLANLLVAVGLLFIGIRLAPFGKQLFLLLALLPMTMFELVSVSSDALTISGAMFFTALLLWASSRVTLRGVDLALVLTASAVLLNVKPGYEALVLLVFLVRPSQVGGRARYAAFAVANIVVVGGLFLAEFVLTGRGGGTINAGAAIGQAGGFLGVLWFSVLHDLTLWILETIALLGWLHIVLPVAFYVFVVLAGLGFFFWMREDVRVGVWQRLLLAAVGLAGFLTISVALYAFLPLAPDGSLFLQGRYLAPVWLLVLLSVYGIRFARGQLGRWFAIAVAVTMMAQNFQTLTSVYHS